MNGIDTRVVVSVSDPKSLSLEEQLKECIPVLQVCPHPPTPASRVLRPTPKMGEGEPESKSLSRSGRGI